MSKIFKILDRNYIEKLFKRKKNIYFPNLKNKKILAIKIKKESPDWAKETVLASYEIIFSNNIKRDIWATAKIGESKEKAFKILNYLSKKADFKKELFQTQRPLDYRKEVNALFYQKVEGNSLDLILEKEKLSKSTFKKLAKFLFLLHSIKLKKFRVKILELKDYQECFFQLKKIVPFYQNLFPPFKKILFLKELKKGNHFLHGDFYPSNIVLGKKKIFLIDFDKAGQGNFLIDLLSFYFWFELPKIKPLIMKAKEIEECRNIFLKDYCQLSNLKFGEIKRKLKKFKVKIFLDCLHYVTFRALKGWRKIDRKLKEEFKNSLKTLLKQINNCLKHA